jgi:hypothetical protein
MKIMFECSLLRPRGDRLILRVLGHFPQVKIAQGEFLLV